MWKSDSQVKPKAQGSLSASAHQLCLPDVIGHPLLQSGDDGRQVERAAALAKRLQGVRGNGRAHAARRELVHQALFQNTMWACGHAGLFGWTRVSASLQKKLSAANHGSYEAGALAGVSGAAGTLADAGAEAVSAKVGSPLAGRLGAAPSSSSSSSSSSLSSSSSSPFAKAIGTATACLSRWLLSCGTVAVAQPPPTSPRFRCSYSSVAAKGTR